MRTLMLAFTTGAALTLAACGDDTTTGSIDNDPNADPNAVVVAPADPAAEPVPVEPVTPTE